MANNGIVGNYDAKFITITYTTIATGAIIMSNFTDGDYFAITSEDGFEFRVGADGSEDRINKNITGVSVDLTLMKTSLTNTLLSAAFTVDALTNLGKGSFMMKDLLGVDFINSGQAYITKRADFSLGNSPGSITWNFRLPQAIVIIGGSLV